MKLANEFKDFLSNTVNLNQTRITLLDARVEAIKTFLRGSDWEPTISTFIEQGSWAHDTIIRPVDGWSAAQYVKELGRIFLESGRYADKTVIYDYCVTVTYTDDCKIDIAPLVMDRNYQGTLEVCNKRNDKFEESQPIEYTRWIREKNGYSGSNSFRKATRLVKYIRDIKKRFSCPSVLLTTLIGHRIDCFDKDSESFADTPSALQTIVGRLDDWLQARPNKPVVENPSLTTQNFADLWNDTQYTNFRNFVNKYRQWIDDAIKAETRSDSIAKWRKIFGDEFAKGEVAKTVEASVVLHTRDLLMQGAAHLDSLVENVISFGINILPPSFRNPSHLQSPTWQNAEHVSRNVQVFAEYCSSQYSTTRHRISSGEALPPRGGLWFDVRVNKFQTVPNYYYVRWRITNTGAVAMALNKGYRQEAI
jgi:hypothetical protein